MPNQLCCNYLWFSTYFSDFGALSFALRIVAVGHAFPPLHSCWAVLSVCLEKEIFSHF